jgi:hypothetical protein
MDLTVNQTSVDEWPSHLAWGMLTPDGHGLRVHREGSHWVVESGQDTSKSRSLDVALIDVIRQEHDVEGHGQSTEYASWIRQIAASIEGPAPPEN